MQPSVNSECTYIGSLQLQGASIPLGEPRYPIHENLLPPLIKKSLYTLLGNLVRR